MFRALQNGSVVRRLTTATVASSSSSSAAWRTTMSATPRTTTNNKMAFLSSAAAAAVSKKQATSTIPIGVGGQLLSSLTLENPHVNVVRYHHKNRVWTLQHVEYYSEAMAIGFAETGLKPGDAVLSWLPLHFSEQVRVYKIYIFIYIYKLL
jgi:hypothetical protein